MASKNEFLVEKNVVNMNGSEATVFAAKLIADAIDRHTNLQKTNVEIQMKMAGVAGEMFDAMKKSLDQFDEGDEWKNKNKDEDED